MTEPNRSRNLLVYALPVGLVLLVVWVLFVGYALAAGYQFSGLSLVTLGGGLIGALLAIGMGWAARTGR